MKKDAVDDILEQWSEERPELETSSLGVVIRILALSRGLKNQATFALGPLDLELFEYDVLSALRRQGPPYALLATELAKETGLSSGAMTNRVDRLEVRGLVRRRSKNNDRKTVMVSLTAAGRKLIDNAIKLRLGAADDCLRDLTPGDRSNLANLLRKVRVME